jgi:hypothetical protein
MTTESKTEWKVEGNGQAARILANCLACHDSAMMYGPPEKVSRQAFKHGGCAGKVEAIPKEIINLYLQHAIIPEN